MLNAANYPYNGNLEGGMSMVDWRGPTNPDLKWETTDQFNAGIDMGFMDNRLSFTVDYYYKRRVICSKTSPFLAVPALPKCL